MLCDFAAVGAEELSRGAVRVDYPAGGLADLAAFEAHVAGRYAVTSLSRSFWYRCGSTAQSSQ